MADRDLTSSFLTAILAGHVPVALLYEGEFTDPDTEATEYLRLWTGIGSLSWDAKTWTGGGHLLSISPIRESASLQAVGFEGTFSGLDATKVALSLEHVRRNKPGRLWLAVFDSAGAVIADPCLLKRGKLSMSSIADNGETASIKITYEDRLIALRKPLERRYTHEDQQQRLAGDMGFSNVESLQDASFALS